MIDHPASPVRDPLHASDSNERIRTVTGETFAPLVLHGEGPIVVELMSYGCAYSRLIEPILQEVAAHVRHTQTTFRVNIVVEPQLAAQYEIHVTPTFLMWLNGRLVARAERPYPTVPRLLTALTEPFA